MEAIKGSSLLRRNEYPQRQQREEKWFRSYNAPCEVVDPNPASPSTLEAFKDVIWNRKTHEIISTYGMTPNEMAHLCGEGEGGWLLSSHVVHLLNKMTQGQKHTLCFCLNATNASTTMRQLQKEKPGFKDIHQLVFVINVGKHGDDSVYIGGSDHPGKHWTLAVVTLSTWEVVYCDSLAWGVPDGLLHRLEEFTSFFDVRLSMKSFKICHTPSPSGQNHTCQGGCTNYPLQSCINICGIVALVCAAIATFDLALFEFLCKTQSPADFYLRNPTKYDKYLRFVLISWIMTGKIDIHHVSLKEIPEAVSEDPMIVVTYAQEVEVTLDRKRKRTADESKEQSDEAVSKEADGSPPIKCSTPERVEPWNREDDHVRSVAQSPLNVGDVRSPPVSDEKDSSKSVSTADGQRKYSEDDGNGQVTVQTNGVDSKRILDKDKTDARKSPESRVKASAPCMVPKARQVLLDKLLSKIGPKQNSDGHITGGSTSQATNKDNEQTLVPDKTAATKPATTVGLAASPLKPGQLFLLKLSPTVSPGNSSGAGHVQSLVPLQLASTTAKSTDVTNKKDGKKAEKNVGGRQKNRTGGKVPVQVAGTNTESTDISDKKDAGQRNKKDDDTRKVIIPTKLSCTDAGSSDTSNKNDENGADLGLSVKTSDHSTGEVTVQSTDTDAVKTVAHDENDTEEAETTGEPAVSSSHLPKPGQLLLVKLADKCKEKVGHSTSLYDCPLCQRKLSSRQSRHHHLKVMHPNEKIQKPLRRMRRKPLEPGQVASTYTCPYCQAEMASRQSLFRHKQKIHPDERKEEPPRGKILCSKCKDFQCRKVKELINHLNSTHGDNFQIQKDEFVSEDEFHEWKKNLERTHDTWFVKVSGGSNYHDHKVQYYYCNRSGGSRGSRARTSRRRAIKSQGSSKMKENCCAFLSSTVIKSTGRVTAEYCIDHTHETKIAHLKMSDQLRSFVVQKLSSGMEVTEILNEIRDNMSKLDGRDKLVSRRDILNIKRQYKVSSAQKDENDSDSADIGTSNSQSQEYIPVVIVDKDTAALLREYIPGVIYNAQGDNGFLLGIQTKFQRDIMIKFGPNAICITSTHKRVQSDLGITTIAVVDNYSDVIPVAWLVSERQDESILISFMETVKLRVGDIKCDVFMSDITRNFYDAWCCVFHSPVRRLFCTKQVKKDWSKNVQSRITEKKLQKDVIKTLDILLSEVDELEFRNLLVNFLTELEIFAPEFRRYFFDLYVEDDKIRFWAACFRIGTIVHTNNTYLETLNRDLKDVDLKKNEKRQCDDLMKVFLRKSKDRAHEHYIKYEKGMVTRKVTEARKGHQVGVELVGGIEAVKDGEEWNITSDDSHYVVKKTKDSCYCKLKCSFCNVCIHMFTCNCSDYSVQSVACKHVHSVKMYQNERKTESVSSDDETTETVEYVSNSPENYFASTVQKPELEMDLNKVKKMALDDIAKLLRLVEIGQDATSVKNSMKFIKAAIATVKGNAHQAEFVMSDESFDQRDLSRKQETKKDGTK